MTQKFELKCMQVQKVDGFFLLLPTNIFPEIN
jgi:hypothetical protein